MAKHNDTRGRNALTDGDPWTRSFELLVDVFVFRGFLGGCQEGFRGVFGDYAVVFVVLALRVFVIAT